MERSNNPILFSDLSKNQKRWLFVILGVVVCLFVFGFFWQRMLKREHKMTSATIINCYLVGGGRSVPRFHALFRYEVNGKRYTDNAPIACGELNEEELNSKLSGKSIPLLYNPRWPSNNFLLSSKAYYEKFNLTMPDSLRWLDSFLMCK